jgi:hypothetical protein
MLPIPFQSQHLMMRPDAKVEKVYLYPKPVDFRKSIDGLAALAPQQASQPNEDFVLGAQRLLLWLKLLESERFKT